MGFIEELKKRNEEQEEARKRTSDLRKQAEQEIKARRIQALAAYNEGSISIVFEELYRDRLLREESQNLGRTVGETSLKIHEHKGGYWNEGLKSYAGHEDSEWVINVELRWDDGFNRGHTAIGCQFYPDGSTIIWGKSREKLPKTSMQNENVVEQAVKRAFENPYKEKPPSGGGRGSGPWSGYEPGGGPCLPEQSLISTPSGLAFIKDVKVGDMIWTVDDGKKVKITVAQTVRRNSLKNHKMAHIILEDGRELLASPGHPTTESKELGVLRPGEILDGSQISSIKIIPYVGKYTYDILPFGVTGVYWANEILIGSTLTDHFARKLLTVNSL